MYFNDSDFVKAAVGFGGICAILGAAIFAVWVFLVPWLWALVKPWLHAATG